MPRDASSPLLLVSPQSRLPLLYPCWQRRFWNTCSSLKRSCSFLRSNPRIRSLCLYSLSLSVNRYCHGCNNMTLRSSFQTQETTGNPKWQVPTLASWRENPTVSSRNLLLFYSNSSPHPALNQASGSSLLTKDSFFPEWLSNVASFPIHCCHPIPGALYPCTPQAEYIPWQPWHSSFTHLVNYSLFTKPMLVG